MRPIISRLLSARFSPLRVGAADGMGAEAYSISVPRGSSPADVRDRVSSRANL